MARINIDLPQSFIFSSELSIRVSDLNYGAHVGHDAILTLMQEARVLFYRSLGFNDEISFEGSVGQIIADAAIVYKSEAFLGDQIVIQIAARDFTKYGFDLLYLVSNKASQKEIARGKTGIVCFDYDQRKIASVPSILLEKFSSCQSQPSLTKQ